MIQSPCNKICTLNADHICVGCGRSRAEIAGWSQFTEAEQQRVVAKARERLDAMGESDRERLRSVRR